MLAILERCVVQEGALCDAFPRPNVVATNKGALVAKVWDSLREAGGGFLASKDIARTRKWRRCKTFFKLVIISVSIKFKDANNDRYSVKLLSKILNGQEQLFPPVIFFFLILGAAKG